MANSDTFAQMLQELDGYVVSIGYQPLEGEADYRNAPLPEYLRDARSVVPQDRHTDPFKLRDESMHGLPKKLCIFVPGKAFDTSGTRHGHGGGWYDRFLSHIPEEWMLIGVAKRKSLSNTPLPKEPWDVSMDWLIVQNDDNTWEALETHARH